MMRRIRSQVDVRSETFQRYRTANRTRISEFRRRQEQARFERPERDMERLSRHGKLFVRERIERLIAVSYTHLTLPTKA